MNFIGFNKKSNQLRASHLSVQDRQGSCQDGAWSTATNTSTCVFLISILEVWEYPGPAVRIIISCSNSG